jgi:hypothetical protein
MTGQLTASDMTSEAVLSVPDFFAAAAEVMAERGWIKGTCAGPNGEVCEVGAVLKVVCTPGDQHLALEVLSHRGGGVDHNDHPGNTAEGSLKLLRSLGPITEADMAAVFGPNWRAVRTLVRQASIATVEQLVAVAQLPKAPWFSALKAAEEANRWSVWGAARAAVWSAVWAAASTTVPRLFEGVVRNTLLAVTLADLAGQYGLEQDDLDALRAPWADIFGDPLEVTA